MREVLSREGREAKNLLVYQFCDETTSGQAGFAASVAAAGSGAVVNGDCKSESINIYISFCTLLFVCLICNYC